MTATALSWAAERLVRTPGGWDALRAGGEPYAEATRGSRSAAACAAASAPRSR